MQPHFLNDTSNHHPNISCIGFPLLCWPHAARRHVCPQPHVSHGCQSFPKQMSFMPLSQTVWGNSLHYLPLCCRLCELFLYIICRSAPPCLLLVMMASSFLHPWHVSRLDYLFLMNNLFSSFKTSSSLFVFNICPCFSQHSYRTPSLRISYLFLINLLVVHKMFIECNFCFQMSNSKGYIECSYCCLKTSIKFSIYSNHCYKTHQSVLRM